MNEQELTINEKKLMLKIEAYKEELSRKTELVADLRVDITILSETLDTLRMKNQELEDANVQENEDSTESN